MGPELASLHAIFQPYVQWVLVAVLCVAWKLAIWGAEFDEFTVYQTTNEARIS